MSNTGKLTAAVASLVLAVCAGAVPGMAQPDIEQRRACAPDVVRLCREFVPNAELINKCLAEKKAELSPACLAVITGPQTTPAPTPVKQPAVSTPKKAKVIKAKYRKRSHDCDHDDD
jgi:hypothetical protein